METIKVFMHRQDVNYKEHEMDTLKRYLTINGWAFVDNADDADILFFGSGYVPKEYVDVDKLSVCFFWGVPYFRLLDTEYRKEIHDKIQNIGKCCMVLTPSVTSSYQAFDFGLNPMCTFFGADRSFIEAQPPREMKNQIICINRITPHKRIDLIIRAVAKSKTKPKLVLVGDCEPPTKKNMLYLAEKLDVDCEIKELNWDTYAEDKIAELKRSKALISASCYEGFGISPAEALMCNRIPILFDIPVFREIYKEDAKYFTTEEELAEYIDWVMAVMDRSYIVPEATKERLDIKDTAKKIDNVMGDLIKKALGQKVRNNINDRKIYVDAYDVEHIRDFQFSSHRFNPDWERHWRVPKAKEALIGKKVLDLGCSYGAYTVNFARCGFDVTAADCSPIALQQCKGNVDKYGFADKVRLVETFADKLPFADGEFDSLWAGEILEHIPDHLLNQSIKEIMRVVRTGGRIIISTPYLHAHDDPLHLRHYDIDGFKKEVLSLIQDDVNILELGLIGEGNLQPSCIFCVLEKR